MTLKKSLTIFGSALLTTAVVAGALQLNRPASSASTQSTDDAYIQADFTIVAPQISGTIADVLVEEHQSVKVGDLLTTIDDRDFVLAAQSAKALVDGAQAHVAGLQARLQLQDTAIRQAQAALTADQASLKLARANQQRYRNLAADGSGTLQALQQAEAQVSIQSAAEERNQAGLQAAQQQVHVLRADLAKARASLAQAKAGLAAARLRLTYTRIAAPVAGTIGQKAARVGAFVNAGKPLLVIVPLDALYIEANFRETQLARVQAGDAVDIEVDALPGERLQGTVESLGPASGVSYSAVAPHNATGNFTKIVQRLPVRIRIRPGQAAATRLRVGMSVTPTIHVNGQAG